MILHEEQSKFGQLFVMNPEYELCAVQTGMHEVWVIRPTGTNFYLSLIRPAVITTGIFGAFSNATIIL